MLSPPRNTSAHFSLSLSLSLSLRRTEVAVPGRSASWEIQQLSGPHDNLVIRRQLVRSRADVDALCLALRERLPAGGRERAALDVDLANNTIDISV